MPPYLWPKVSTVTAGCVEYVPVKVQEIQESCLNLPPFIFDFLITRECEVDEPDPDGEHPPGCERRGVEGGEEDHQEYRLRRHCQAVCGSIKKEGMKFAIVSHTQHGL